MNPRRRKIAVVFTFAFASAILFLIWKSVYRAEPTYNGKRLTEWVRQYGSNHWGGDRALAREAESAIREIGIDGIPVLLDLIQTTDSGLKKRLRTMLPRAWHDRLNLVDRNSEIRRLGGNGFFALGTDASTAVSSLIRIASEARDQDSRYVAVFALRTLGVAAESALPFFVGCLTNHDAGIRDEAAIALGNFHQQSKIAVPALIKYLEDAKSLNAYEIRDATSSLSRLGTNANAAVPTLIGLLKHSDPSMRSQVTNCLLEIDAETAEKAGVRRQRQ